MSFMPALIYAGHSANNGALIVSCWVQEHDVSGGEAGKHLRASKQGKEMHTIITPLYENGSLGVLLANRADKVRTPSCCTAGPRT